MNPKHKNAIIIVLAIAVIVKLGLMLSNMKDQRVVDQKVAESNRKTSERLDKMMVHGSAAGSGWKTAPGAADTTAVADVASPAAGKSAPSGPGAKVETKADSRKSTRTADVESTITPLGAPSPGAPIVATTTSTATSATDAAKGGRLEKELSRLSRKGLGILTQEWRESHGDDSWPVLVSLAANTKLDSGERYFALHAALEIGGAKAASQASSLLGDHDPGMRCVSLLGLGEIHDLSLLPRIEPLLHDPAMVVRDCALIAVIRIQGSKGAHYVLETIGYGENYIHGSPLPIVKRAFDLLDILDTDSEHSQACQVFQKMSGSEFFQSTRRRWDVCKTFKPAAGSESGVTSSNP